jgi:hypothetical protein
MSAKTRMLRAVAVVAGLFGVLTIRAGGDVLFGGIEARIAAGDVVPFVLWFNFLAGFAYIAAAIGLWMARPWGAWTAITIAATTALAFALLGVHVSLGGTYEMRTVWAMTLRAVLWSGIAALAFWKMGISLRNMPRSLE